MESAWPTWLMTHLDVEATGQQSDGDVGPPESMRCRPWKRGKSARGALLGRECRTLSHDLGDTLPAHSAAAHVLHHVVVGLRAVSRSAEAVDMVYEGLSQVGAHLDDPDAGLGL